MNRLKNGKHPPFVMLPHAVMDSDGFASLSPVAIAVLLLLLRKHNGQNNGGISLGVREAARWTKCHQSTAGRALKELQPAGLISIVHKGHLVPLIAGRNIASMWHLDFINPK